jgi:exopolysaccharide biosynthesis protein
LDLFEEQDAQTVLNGMYYEQSSGKFVSYVLGRRHFEVSPGRCLGDKEWKERIMRERAI